MFDLNNVQFSIYKSTFSPSSRAALSLFFLNSLLNVHYSLTYFHFIWIQSDVFEIYNCGFILYITARISNN